MHDWQVNKKHTCVQPESCRAMPEKEKPPAMRVDLYFAHKPHKYLLFQGSSSPTAELSSNILKQ